MNRTHYEILGLSSHATHNEIQRAYHQLAKRYHPDIAGEEQEFKAITEAYNILKDPDSKSTYDLSLNKTEEATSNLFDVFTSANPILSITLPLAQRDAIFGAKLSVTVTVPHLERNSNCPKCSGTGNKVVMENGFPFITPCECGNKSTEEVELSVTVPPKSHTGDRIELPPLGPYRLVRIFLEITDPLYSWDHGNLVYFLPISTLDLITGCKKRIPFFEKYSVLTIPPGTNIDKEFTISNTTYPENTITVKLKPYTPQLQEDQINLLKEQGWKN